MFTTVVFAMDLAGDREHAAFRYLGFGTGALLVGGVSWFVNSTVARAQQSRADGIAESKWRKGTGIVVTSLLLLLQAGALVMLLGGEVLALNKAFQRSDGANTPNELLLEELKEYEGMLSEAKEIEELCLQYIEHDRATNAFVSICERFEDGQRPDPGEVEGMIDRLVR